MNELDSIQDRAHPKTNNGTNISKKNDKWIQWNQPVPILRELSVLYPMLTDCSPAQGSYQGNLWNSIICWDLHFLNRDEHLPIIKHI